MNILALTNLDPRRTWGGGRIRDHHLVKGLLEMGDVTCKFFEDPNFSPEKFMEADGWGGARLRSLGRVRGRSSASVRATASGRLYGSERFPFHRYDLSAEDDFAVIYASMLYAAIAVVGELAAVPANERPVTVWDTHNFDPDVWFQRAESWTGMKSLLARRDARRSAAATAILGQAVDLIIACSDEDARALNRLGVPQAKISVIHNGVDLGQWLGIPRPERLTRAPVFVVFGSLAQESTAHGVIQFVTQVWPSFAEKNRHARLIVTGRSPSDRLMRIGQETRQVEIIPNPIDIRKVVAEADCIVLPQAFGTGSKLKVFEALASGRPVVGTPEIAVGLAGNLQAMITTCRSVEEWHRSLEPDSWLRVPPDQLSDALEPYDWRTHQRQLVEDLTERLGRHSGTNQQL